MNNVEFNDFYQVPNIKFDIFKLRTDLEKILKNKKEVGTSLGATNLFNIKRKNKLDTITINTTSNQKVKKIYQTWEENLYNKELFSHA